MVSQGNVDFIIAATKHTLDYFPLRVTILEKHQVRKVETHRPSKLNRLTPVVDWILRVVMSRAAAWGGCKRSLGLFWPGNRSRKQGEKKSQYIDGRYEWAK